MGLLDIFKRLNGSDCPVKIKTEVTYNPDLNVVPIAKRLLGIEPACNGLYPHEILMLSYASQYPVGNKEFPGFWWYAYGVKKPEGILSSLTSRGFLTVGGLESTISNLTVSDLKSALKSHGLRTTGAKSDLIKRVISEIPAEELESKFPVKYYELTELGKETVNKEPCISYVHHHPVEDLDIFSMSQLVHSKPYMPYRDKIWQYLNRMSMQYTSKGDFGFYRNCRLRMAQFVKEEGRTVDALHLLCEVLFYDANDMTNGFDLSYTQFYVDHMDVEHISLPIVKMVVDYQKDVGFSDDELLKFIRSSMSNIKNELALFSSEEAFEIVKAEITDDKSLLPEIFATAKKRYKRKFHLRNSQT